ncbi:hypothetical protein GCM10010862_51120 [Devosia nitrariae]|uniref:TRASH domain-containing protein n=1 Tax=Devosia nitrariae TaxID=2071872 RepID=A0ABQ5WCL6_9HYPH|nr:hypothetical protein GCM10010862_51120 [Devosia nitrariae]
MSSDLANSNQHHHPTHGRTHGANEGAGDVTKDPVCGMTVNPDTAEHKATYRGTTYHFCSQACRDKFMADPDRYLESTAAPPQVAQPGTIWTCPMHPQIRRNEPGSCPICGMALEPELPTAETGPSPELVDMTRRFWIASALALPVFVLEMTSHLIDLHQWISGQGLNWTQLVLATPAVLWAGWPFFDRGVASVRNRSLNMFTLIGMGIGVAWFYSLVATVLPGAFPASMREMGGGVPVYFEAAAVITALALLGQVLELRAREQTSGAIRALLDLAPGSSSPGMQSGPTSANDFDNGGGAILATGVQKVRPRPAPTVY